MTDKAMQPNIILLPAIIALVAVLLITARRRNRAGDEHRSELLELSERWQPPYPLSLPAPRTVRLTLQGKVIVAIFLVMAAGMAGLSFSSGRAVKRELQRVQALERASVVTNGEVVRRRTAPGSRTTRYFVTYRFETAAGERFIHEASVRRRVYENVREGSRVDVRYLPDQPEVSGLLADSPTQDRWMLLALPAVILGFVFIAFIPIRQQKRLIEWGRAAPAIVVKVASSKGGKAVRYHFLDATGNVRAGLTMMTNIVPAAGETVAVLFDPDRPERNTSYPAPLFRIEQTLG